MDEILIDERNYVSAKKAAKLTGYARDYVGQLCREGRVPARLVGRSWYVLESAIQDHRFGTPSHTGHGEALGRAERVVPATETIRAHHVDASMWASPRYEPETNEELPVVQREIDKQNIAISDTHDLGTMQDTWHEWYSQAPVQTDAEEATVMRAQEESAEESKRDSQRASVPHEASRGFDIAPMPSASSDERYQEVVEADEGDTELRITSTYDVPVQPTRSAKRRGARRAYVALVQLACIIAAATASLTAMLNSGYFDTYIASYSQASVITGIRVVNK